MVFKTFTNTMTSCLVGALFLFQFPRKHCQMFALQMGKREKASPDTESYRQLGRESPGLKTEYTVREAADREAAKDTRTRVNDVSESGT